MSWQPYEPHARPIPSRRPHSSETAELTNRPGSCFAQNMPVTDEDAALAAISTLEELSAEQHDALQAINIIVNNGDPFVDVHELFAHYNVLYFRKLLLPGVEVLWSPRLTLCAGICELSKDPSTGKLTRIRLKLSTPLLQFRPRPDTINTLLHEAIHAYFFVTTSWRHAREDGGTGHGLGFQLLADAINTHGKYQVTIYHTFHDEVDSYRTHVWQCDGPCRTQPPYFGLVKRTMNRVPGKSDTWWAKHQVECGGIYTKIQEPAPTKKQLDALSMKERAGRQTNKLDSWVTVGAKRKAEVEGETSPQTINAETKSSTKTQKVKKIATTMEIDKIFRPEASSRISEVGQKRSRASDDEVPIVEKKLLVECPICNLRLAESEINEHLDVVHP
ncbi:SprT-like family-domain-containing protein [Pyrenochaeta sp. MPI-SDFR-AT-0127]|nr:SprT-like family-domain-containing protein [Pyrenochaeta sp. MPI-SDFR-AT-0127]